jgi:GAF domain-containing protein
VSARRQRLAASKERGTVRRLAEVRGLREDPRYLYRLIETIGSSPDLETILRGVSLLVTEATHCHACMVWFVQGDRLVLRSASPPYSHLAGSVSMGVDEGLAGWVVRTRRSAFIEERALDDSRVKYFPELEEERFQSLVSVPIFARDAEVLGVIALHAEAPHEFGRDDLDLLEHTASLIAGAVENARLYENATARITLLSELSRLSQTIASSATEEEVVEIVCDGVRELLGADRVELHLTTPDGRSRPAGVRPERVRSDRATDRPLVPDRPEAWPVEPPRSEPRTRTIALPLIAGEERLGLLAASSPADAPGADAALAAVAAHTGVAITRHRAIVRLTAENLVKDLFRELARTDATPETINELARRLRCDLELPHLVLHVIGWAGTDGRGTGRGGGRPTAWPEARTQFESLLADAFPGALLDGVERTLRALVPTRSRSTETVVAALRRIAQPSVGGGLSIGVSNLCRGQRSFAHGFEEAEAAAEVGGLLRGGAGVTTFDELGPYRYLLGAGDDERDATQQRLSKLVDYDRRRGTRLLDTLESYLDHRGSVTTTSRDLIIHTNTLRQRLERIERLSGIDLERADWLSLAVANKVVKLRRMKSTRREGGNDG